MVSTESGLGRSLKKGGRVSSDTHDLPERVDTDVGESNNAQVLFAVLNLRGGGGKVLKKEILNIINFTPIEDSNCKTQHPLNYFLVNDVFSEIY